jgi:hypothetical protein
MRLLTSLLLLLIYQYVTAQTNHWETAVYENDTRRYMVPTSEPDTNWRKPNFSTAAWNQGPGGFGFGYHSGITAILLTSKLCEDKYIFNVNGSTHQSSTLIIIQP